MTYIDESPVEFLTENGAAGGITVANDHAYISLTHAQFSSPVETNFTAGLITASHCAFECRSLWRGEIEVSGCRFDGEADFSSWDSIAVIRCIFTAGLDLHGRFDGAFTNNTFAQSSTCGLRLDSFGNVTLTNNIFAFNRWGIINDCDDRPVLRYNEVFGSRNEDYVDCEPGEGDISLDPLFTNRFHGEFSLREGSPCIDAGDPASLRDPDGTVADIGAQPYAHPEGVGDKRDAYPTRWGLVGVYPNPFNSSTLIQLSVEQSVAMRLWVMDHTGREVARLVEGQVEAGSCEVSFEAADLPAGIYFAILDAAGERKVVKMAIIR